ncbi:unnamed protein product [Symbiodinium natans]|uniref:Pentatricopeptide repeat-containing protein, chloroplastic n=1 Tax=Symbiodinium natans TaxID=878477 RepID=A0A812KVW6_9DINO|nr:unnamed protein product [Symbiodinium natans]
MEIEGAVQGRCGKTDIPEVPALARKPRLATAVLRKRALEGTAWSLLRRLCDEEMEADVVHFSCIITPDWCQALWLRTALAASAIAPNVILETRLVTSCAHANWLAAVQLLREAESIQRDAVLLNSAMTALEGRWWQALAHLQTSAALSCTPDAVALNTAISSCHARGVWTLALHLLGVSGNLVDLITLSGAIASAQWLLAVCLLSEMSPAELIPNTICFNAALRAFEAPGLWRRAAGLLKSMRPFMVLPDVVSFTSLLRACEKDGRWRLALSLLPVMRQVTILPNAVTYGCILNACEFAGAWRTALLLLSEMVSMKQLLNNVICNTIISTCEKACQWQSALAFLSEMRRFQVRLDVVGINASLRACGSGDAWPWSLELLRQIDIRGRTNVSFAGAVAACAVANKWAWSLRLLLAMLEDALVPDVNSFGDVAEVCGRLGFDIWSVTVLDKLQTMQEKLLYEASKTLHAEVTWEVMRK